MKLRCQILTPPKFKLICKFNFECFVVIFISDAFNTKIVSEYDQEIPRSQTADKPMAQRGRATQQSRDTRKTN